MTHTPSPWHIVHDSTITISDGLDESAIAYLEHYDSEEVTLANAHLIAAAPDLLTAAEAALRTLQGHTGAEGDAVTGIEIEQRANIANKLYAAITKAKGNAQPGGKAGRKEGDE